MLKGEIESVLRNEGAVLRDTLEIILGNKGQC